LPAALSQSVPIGHHELKTARTALLRTGAHPSGAQQRRALYRPHPTVARVNEAISKCPQKAGNTGSQASPPDGGFYARHRERRSLASLRSSSLTSLWIADHPSVLFCFEAARVRARRLLPSSRLNCERDASLHRIAPTLVRGLPNPEPLSRLVRAQWRWPVGSPEQFAARDAELRLATKRMKEMRRS
jgi:hypothetical protein